MKKFKTKLFVLCALIVLSVVPNVMSETDLTKGDIQLPDSLFIPTPNARNNRAVGVGVPVAPEKTLVLANINSPGIMRHFWLVNEKVKTEQLIMQGSCTIRFYWDGNTEPDLEIPLNEFFGKKFTDSDDITFPMQRAGKNAYYTMPFRKSAKVELKNYGTVGLRDIYWQIDYELYPEIPESMKYFDLNTKVAQPVSLPESAKKADQSVKDAKTLEPATTVVIGEIKGPAVIRRLKISHTEEDKIAANRGVAIRIFWDDETNPSVECPIGDFYGVGFGENGDMSTQAWIEKNGDKEIYFPMPFKKSARIELVNLTNKPFKTFSWQVDYEKNVKFPPEIEYFHASYRESRPVPLNSVHFAMDTEGRGKFVGFVWSHHWINMEKHAEGTQNFWVDGLHVFATGSEDYFGQGWGFIDKRRLAYKGNSLDPTSKSMGEGVGEWYKVTAYRTHILDPIHFQKSLKLDYTNNGVDVGLKTDEYDTVCFWYQSEPHTPFVALPPAEDLYPVEYPQSYAWGMWKIYNLERENKFDEVISIIDGLLKNYPKNPKSADVTFKKGYLLEEQNKIKEALAVYKSVKEQYPDSDAAKDADDKLWMLGSPGRMLLKMSAASGCIAYIDGTEVVIDSSVFQDMPSWGIDKIFKFNYAPARVMWNDISSIPMRLPTVRLEPGSGVHCVAIKAVTSTKKPVASPKRGYMFAALDIAGPDIVTDGSWKMSPTVTAEDWATKEFNDADWAQAIVYKFDRYQDSTWTWLWPRTFRNFPARVDRIWDSNLKTHGSAAFKETLYFRQQISIP